MGERKPTSLKVDPELWEEVKIMSIRVHKNITRYFEDALRERLVKDYEIVAAERKRKEQERLQQEQLDQRYQQIINTDPGVDAYNKDKDRSKTIHQLGEEPPNRLTGIDADKVTAKASGRIVEEQLQQQQLIPEGSKHLHQSGLQQASELKEKMNKDDQHLLHLLETFPVISRINLPGLRFPATKNEIIECAERANTEQIIKILRENLPDSKYNSPEHIETERALTSSKNKYSFAKYFRGLDKTLKVKRRIGKFTVDTREIRQDQRKQLLQQQEQEFAQITKSN